MATDSSEPRVGLIAIVGASSVVILLVTRAFLGTYFDHEVQDELHRKMGLTKPAALMSLRASEATRLTSGALPIDQAMSQLATRGRMGIGPDMAPSASRDVAPLQGWAKMPSDVPSAMMAPPPEAPVAAGVDAGPGAAGKSPDAGRKRGPDAGAMHRFVEDVGSVGGTFL